VSPEEVAVPDRHYPTNAWSRLTLTELAAAKFVCDGLSEADTATRLDVAAETMHAVLDALYAKLGIASRVELVIQAVDRRVLT
jgi:DNA-binding NarL/FixJ family response regulator